MLSLTQKKKLFLRSGLRNFANSLVTGKYFNPLVGPVPTLTTTAKSRKGWWGKSTAKPTKQHIQSEHFLGGLLLDTKETPWVRKSAQLSLLPQSLQNLRKGMDVESCLQVDKDLRRQEQNGANNRGNNNNIYDTFEEVVTTVGMREFVTHGGRQNGSGKERLLDV